MQKSKNTFEIVGQWRLCFSLQLFSGERQEFYQRELQSQQIYMERNKPSSDDYGLPQAPQSKGSSPRTSVNPHSHDPGQDSMFLKYASSIIQVVSQDKLDRSNQFNTSREYPDAVIEVSEVNSFEGGSKMKSNEHSQLSKDSNLYQHFMKKKKKAKIFVYNFTNFSTFITSINKIIAATTKQAFQELTRYTPKSQPQQPWIPSHKKVRSSVQSKSTSYSIIEQLRSRNKLESHKKVAFSEEAREGANAIKGWIQFKILLLQNAAYRSIMEYVNELEEQYQYEDLSPIAAGKKSAQSENFCLTEYQPESSMNIDANMHHLQESLAYTIDNNYELGSKDTMATPGKLSQVEKFQLKSKYLMGGNPSQAKESIVSPYKAHLKGSKASKKSVFFEEKATITPADTITLKLASERRYLAIRTNLFELPMISQLDLRNNGSASLPCSALMNDQMGCTQPEVCDNVDLLLKDFEGIEELLESRTNKTIINSDKSQQSNMSKQYFASVRQKYSRVVTESSQDYEHGTRTCKLKSKNSLKYLPEPEAIPMVVHQRQAPHKVEKYYFPGRQLRATHKKSQHNIDESTTNRLDDVKQVDSILSTVRKQPLRYQPRQKIEQSLVNNYQIVEDGKMRHMMRSADGFASKTERIQRPNSKNVQQQYRPFQEMKSVGPSLLKESNRPSTKINIALSSHRSQSPSMSNMLPLGSVQKKQQPLISPRNTKFQHPFGSPSQLNPSRPSPQMYNPRPSPNHYQLHKPVQQEVGSTVKKMEPVMRPTSREPHNIYQINQNNNFQQKTNITNIHNYHQQPMRPTSRITGPQEPIHNYQSYGGAYAQPQPQQPMPRPNSKIFSPQHCIPAQQSVFPAKSRQNSRGKNMYFSPQVNKQTYGLQPPSIKFQHQRPQMFTSSGQTIQEYFKTQTVQPRNSDRNNNFSNRYYRTGPSGRQPHLMTEQQKQPPIPQPLDATRKAKPHGLALARPHSSSRQSQERINIFSNWSPGDSQLQPSKRSFHHLSSCASKMVRPHSMNDKIQLTLRHR